MGRIKNIALGGLALLLLKFGMGCGPAPKPSVTKVLQDNAIVRTDAQVATTVNDLLTTATNGVKLVKQYGEQEKDKIRNNEDPVLKETKTLETAVEDLKKENIEAADNLYKEVEQISVPTIEGIDLEDTKPISYSTRNNSNKGEGLFNISLYQDFLSQDRTTESAYDEKAEDLYNLTGVKFSYDLPKSKWGFGAFLEGGTTREITADYGNGNSSNIDTKLSGGGLFAKYNFINGPRFKFDVDFGVGSLTEIMDGTATLNGTDYDIYDKETFTTLNGNANFNWKLGDNFLAGFHLGYTQLDALSNSDDINSKGAFRSGVNVGVYW